MANVLALAGPNSKYQLPEAAPAGFLAGLWHGLLCPITFFISVFNPKVRIYEMNNRGRLYDLGFVIGASGAFGGGATSTTTF